MNLSPLQTDSKREAADSVRGYVYQLWHSVHAWLDLTEDEVLFLEAAEDFDIVSGTKAITTQVKARSDRISLQSAQVIDALNNFWKLCENNPNKAIVFRFLTQSEIAQERGKPFGNGIKGIRLWEKCQRDREGIQQLREFLLKHTRVSKELHSFLENADEEEMQNKVIAPVKWVTGSRDANYVRKAVEEKLTVLGEKFRIPYSISVGVADALFSRAMTVAASKGERSLNRAILLQIFDEKTNISIPYNEYQELMSNLPQGIAPIITSSELGSVIDFYRRDLVEDSVPNMVPESIEREELEVAYLNCVNENGLVHITGTSGIGKTTLSKLIALRDGGSWYWLGLVGRSSEETRLALRTIQKKGYKIRLIIDDLDCAPRTILRFEEELGSALYTILNGGGRIVITARRELPQRVLSRLGIGGSVIQRVPLLDDAEVLRFALQMGCPGAEQAEMCAKAIMVHSSGHPQLVHAQLTYLRANDWPAIDVKDFLEVPKEIRRVQSEARDFLTVLSKEERELVYRLSVINGPFRRDQAIMIGEIDPALPYPGEDFDGIIGPWIEGVTDKYYSLSPLLGEAAKHVWTENKIKSLHGQIAEAIVRTGALTILEANAIFFHAFIGKATLALSGITFSLLQAPPEAWASIASRFSWWTYVRLEPQKKPYPDDRHVNFLLRWFQYRLALVNDIPNAPAIALAWDKEVVPYEPRSAYLGERYILASTILLHEQAQIGAKQLLSYIIETVQIEKELERTSDYRSRIREMSESISEQGVESTQEVFFLILAYRCTGREYLAELLDGLNNCAEQMRQIFLGYIERNEKVGDFLIIQVWDSEAQSDDADWIACISLLEKVIEHALDWQSINLAVSAIRGIAVIYDEFLDQQSRALEFLDKYLDQYEDNTILNNARATVLLHQKRYEDALSIWKSILPIWQPPESAVDLNPVFACRNAGVAATNLDDFAAAAEFYIEGSDRAKIITDEIYRIGFLADAGYVLWKASNFRESIQQVRQALVGLENYAKKEDNLRWLTTKKLVGHMMLWIWRTVEGGSRENLAEPWSGMCSNPEHDERLRELPGSPLDLTWVMLAQYEYSTTEDSNIFYDIKSLISESLNVHARFFYAELGIQHAVKFRELADFPLSIHSLEVETALLREFAQRGVGTIPSSEVIDKRRKSVLLGSIFSMDLFVAALFATIEMNQSIFEIILQWRNCARAVPGNKKFFNWLDLVNERASSNVQDNIKIMMEGSEDRDKRLLASLLVASDSSVHPNHLYYAHVTLIEIFLFFEKAFRPGLANSYSSLIQSQWLEKIKFRAVLKMPQITVPAIENACQSKSKGLQKAAEILIGASNAVTIHTPQILIELLQKLAKGEMSERKFFGDVPIEG